MVNDVCVGQNIAEVDDRIYGYLNKVQSSRRLERESNRNLKIGLYDRRDFLYIEADDEYKCPAGERLPRQKKRTQGIW